MQEENAGTLRHWRSYRWLTAHRDLLAGLNVAVISLAQGMAYALLACVDKRFGRFSAIVVTTVVSVYGSSSHLINGPASAMAHVVFGALASFEPNASIETQGINTAPLAQALA